MKLLSLICKLTKLLSKITAIGDLYIKVICSILLSCVDETSLQTEWEALDIVSAPINHNQPGAGGALAPHQPGANPLQTASMTMTSAAASIASIFRGLTGR